MEKIRPIPLLLSEQELELKRGYQLGIYTLLEQIGSGGEAVVWSGFDNLRQRVVAVKIISTVHSDPAVASMVPANFEREVHLVASLDHPHILPMYEFGMADTFSYFVMQYKCAGTLADLVKGMPLPLVEVARTAKQVLSALSYLHKRGIVHRDIKPSNVLLDSQTRTYLADFGLAKKLSQSTMVLHTGRGTGPYAPYEQQAYDTITQQSDFFSLGIVIYEMLTGQLPWEAQYNLASLQQRDNDMLPSPTYENPDCPTELTAVLRNFTAFQWQERPQTAEAAYALLYDALPPVVQREVGQELRPVELMEEKFLAQDAAYLLDLYHNDWQAESPYPVSLTHLAFMEAQYVHLPDELEAKVQQILLRGALVHDYGLAEWWQLTANQEVRWQVSLAAMAAEDDEVMARVLALLLREPAGALPTAVSAVASLEKLLDVATTSKEWRLRRDALSALANLVPRAADWQTVGISAAGDAKLAHLALEKSTQGKQAIEIIGFLQSETAVHTLLAAYETDSSDSVVDILRQLQQQAGSLPRLVPVQIRARLLRQRLQEQLLNDQEGLSLPRTLIGLAAGLVTSLLFVLGYFPFPAAQIKDSFLLPYPVSDIVTIVEVDDDSLAQYGRWDQWPRSLHAELIEQLNAAGAQTIVFDFVFEGRN